MDEYLGFNPLRIYNPGDKIIKFNSCGDKLELYQCIIQTSKVFISNHWYKISSFKTQYNLCRGYRADYLGNCAGKLVISNSSKEILPNIPISEEEIYFDNITFI